MGGRTFGTAFQEIALLNLHRIGTYPVHFKGEHGQHMMRHEDLCNLQGVSRGNMGGQAVDTFASFEQTHIVGN